MATTDKVLRNSGALLRVEFFSDGAAQDPDANAVTVTVTDGAGTALATDAVASRVSTGLYQWVLPPQSDLTKLTLDWSGAFGGISQTARTYAEIIGANLFTLNEIRNFGKTNKLSDDTKYLSADIIDIREEITEQFAKYAHVSFVPRYNRVVIDGNGENDIWLPDNKIIKLLSVTIGGTAQTVSSFYVYPDGRIYTSGVWPLANQNVIIEYEHGYEAPPATIARAGMVLTEAFMIGTDILDRTITHTDETGTYRLSFPDVYRERPTGVPYVDVQLNIYSEMWGVA